MSVLDKKPLNGSPSRRLGRLINYFAEINLSIRAKILITLLFVIAMMSLINAIFISQMFRYYQQYDTIITNIIAANSLNGYINPAIDEEMWDIVAGKTDFYDGNQYEILAAADEQIQWMMANADNEKGQIKLEVVLRTLDTLTYYVDLMGEQIEQGSQVADNELVLENIRGVSDVFEESVQDYILFEVEQAMAQYRSTQSRFIRWTAVSIALTLILIAFSILATWIISESIYIPIKKLHDVTTTIAEEDLNVLVTSENANEIAELGLSFNIMINQIQELLDSKIKEQEDRQKLELKTLQAQINPHFLYNTLDTIVWMAESKRTDDVVDLVQALSSFFRITLSKGMDWITIKEEVEHTRSYLTIQKMRYADILDYCIEVDERTNGSIVLKLTLQPLVENALYHGIKNKRHGGAIHVRVAQQDQDCILIEVEDTGIGFSPERLAVIREELANDDHEVHATGNGFGLNNVNKRVKLYYGSEYGLSIESEYGKGTCVSLRLPIKYAV